MERKRTFHSLFLASTALVLFLILALSVVSASPAQRVAGQLTLTETQITTNKSSQEYPAIYGDRIVWEDNRDGQGWKLYIYDISTSIETSLDAGGIVELRPSIYGDRVVWQYIVNGYPYAHMYNFTTSTETQISANKAWGPTISGDRIVCTDLRNGNADIYMYDVVTSQEIRITDNESWQGNPAIYGNRIVWQDARNGEDYSPTDIYMYDLSTSKETQITADDSDQYSPAIYGDRIVWQDNRNGNWDIYMYDLSTQKETQITTSEASQELPAIYEDRIVWQDMRNGYDIYMYDLSTSTETQITTSEYDQIYPAIYGDRIVWEDFRNGMNVIDHPDRNPDIYMCTISEDGPAPEQPVADFSANVTCGYAPLTVQFADLSENAAEWCWDFGDKTCSTAQNPVHTYNKQGKYTVSLTVKNENGMDMEKKNKYISVSKQKRTS